MSFYKGKVIWITGASSGIGASLAMALSKLDCKLVLSARNEGRLREVAERCRAKTDCIWLKLDLGEIDGIDAIVDPVIDKYGKIDMLINNAGVSQRSLIMDTDIQVYKTLMDVNYLGTVALTKQLLPYFVKQQSGHFVTVTSLMGKFSSPYRSGYCAAKHALHGFFDALRMEHEKDGIDVTIICPGFVRTEVAKNSLTEKGTTQGHDDPATQKGMDPDGFCQQMLGAIKQRKFEAYIGGKEVKGVFMKRFFPKRLHKLVMKSQVR